MKGKLQLLVPPIHFDFACFPKIFKLVLKIQNRGKLFQILCKLFTKNSPLCNIVRKYIFSLRHRFHIHLFPQKQQHTYRSLLDASIRFDFIHTSFSKYFILLIHPCPALERLYFRNSERYSSSRLRNSFSEQARGRF